MLDKDGQEYEKERVTLRSSFSKPLYRGYVVLGAVLMSMEKKKVMKKQRRSNERNCQGKVFYAEPGAEFELPVFMRPGPSSFQMMLGISIDKMLYCSNDEGIKVKKEDILSI
jgi:hypothetical protein